MSETAACHPIPLADHPSTLPSPTSSPPPVSDSCLFTRCQPLYASRYTVLLYFSRYCMIRLKMFSLFFCVCLLFTYYLCEKYYKAVTVQHYIAGCVIWLPRLTLQDLRMNGTYQRTVRMELVCMPGTYSIEIWAPLAYSPGTNDLGRVLGSAEGELTDEGFVKRLIILTAQAQLGGTTSVVLPSPSGPSDEPVGCGMSGASLKQTIRRGAQADKYWGEGTRSSAVSATKPFLLESFRPGTQEKVTACSVLSFLVKKTYQPLHCHFPLKSTFSLLISYYSSNAIYSKW